MHEKLIGLGFKSWKETRKIFIAFLAIMIVDDDIKLGIVFVSIHHKGDFDYDYLIVVVSQNRQ